MEKVRERPHGNRNLTYSGVHDEVTRPDTASAMQVILKKVSFSIG